LAVAVVLVTEELREPIHGHITPPNFNCSSSSNGGSGSGGVGVAPFGCSWSKLLDRVRLLSSTVCITAVVSWWTSTSRPAAATAAVMSP